MARADLSQQRLATLELLLLWEGLLNRSRLSSLLDVGDIRASQLIQAFRDQNPQWLTWNTKSRSYHATNEAYAAMNRDDWTKDCAESLSRYLNLVGLPYVIGDVETRSPICAAFPDLNAPSPQIFASLSQAIRLQQSVEIIYRSMSDPTPHNRTISPHHLVRAGRRWHARAFCSAHQDFRDYALGRIVAVNPLNSPQEQSGENDATWNAIVSVRLIAHPDLNRAQEDVIRFEYFGRASVLVVSCRAALVGYFVQDIRAATDIKLQQPPEYQLVVENMDEVSKWLFPC
ncbi:MAG: WYL domain-containing protein [Acidobacteriaceae bacterium]|nr:WYL domain-containing protein [Acidobacteriaceae bacterium]